MITKTVTDKIIINTVPFTKTIIDDENNEIVIEFDDVYQKRRKVVFCPYQAIRIITEDCSTNEFIDDNLKIGEYKKYILEVENSEWIEELKNVLLETDPNANFLEKARHFILDMGDNIIEIIATNIKIM